jgi:hypothetical protein
MKLLRLNPQIQSDPTRGAKTGGSMKLLRLNLQIQSDPTRGATTGGSNLLGFNQNTDSNLPGRTSCGKSP